MSDQELAYCLKQLKEVDPQTYCNDVPSVTHYADMPDKHDDDIQELDFE